MKFFSGFALQGDDIYLKEYIEPSDYSVCGFSYGAVIALKYTMNQLKNRKRVDRLQLFSPAFFQTKDEKFKKLQLLGYRKNQELYLKEFVKSCFLPYKERSISNAQSSIDELDELLHFIWDKEEFYRLKDSGVKIEVYLGGEDKIIDIEGAREFFLEVATVTYIKDANHFLLTN